MAVILFYDHWELKLNNYWPRYENNDSGHQLWHRDQIRSSLFHVDAVEHGQNRVNRQTSFLQANVQARGILVTPTALRQIGVPDCNFFVGWLASMRESPIEDLLIPSPLECPLLQCWIANLKKVATLPVKSVHGSFGRRPLWRQFPLIKQANFIEHSPKMHDPSYGFPGASQARNSCLSALWFTGTWRFIRETRRAPFVCIKEVEKGANNAIGHSRLPYCFFQEPGAFVAPAALLHEAVPDFDIFAGWSSTSLASPLEDGLVLQSMNRSSGHLSVIDAEESTAVAIKTAGVSIAKQSLVLEG